MKYPKAKAGAVDAFCAYLEQHAQGRENAIFGKHLAVALGLGKNWDRKLRALANAANERGVLVCGDDKGYFIAASYAEAEPMLCRLESQAKIMLRRLKLANAIAARKFPDEYRVRLQSRKQAKYLSLGQLALIPN